MTHTLSPAQAGQLATRGRQLLRRGQLTTYQYALLDTVLWAARKPGSATLTASLRVLARLAGQARSTVIEGVRRLEELGLIQRIRVAWDGSVASRVVANGYRLLAVDTETASRSAREELQIISIVGTENTAVRVAQEALAARRKTVEVMLQRKVECQGPSKMPEVGR